MMSRKLLVSMAVVCLVILLLPGCKPKAKNENNGTQTVATEQSKPAPQVMTPDQLIQRGSYLVTTMGCHDCHSPKQMGQNGPELNPAILLSGYQADARLPKVDKRVFKIGWVLLTDNLQAAAGPWGVSFAANLTSDPSGIGSWPEENFTRALRQGKYKGVETGRTLLPPMPWENFTTCTDEDVKAIYAYLKSTKPIHNVVPLAIAPEDIK